MTPPPMITTSQNFTQALLKTNRRHRASQRVAVREVNAVIDIEEKLAILNRIAKLVVENNIKQRAVDSGRHCGMKPNF
jgi:hypothetical protein